jgi:hypothetical protein
MQVEVCGTKIAAAQPDKLSATQLALVERLAKRFVEDPLPVKAAATQSGCATVENVYGK